MQVFVQYVCAFESAQRSFDSIISSENVFEAQSCWVKTTTNAQEQEKHSDTDREDMEYSG